MLKNKKAFTLVEIVVTVSIIILISSIVIFSIADSRRKGRDSKRVSDISQIQIALENYKQIEGSYPEELIPGQALIGPNSKAVFISKIPKSPSYYNFNCPNKNYSYYYDFENNNYEISFCIESNVDNYLAGSKCAVSGGILSTPCSNFCLNNPDECSWQGVGNPGFSPTGTNYNSLYVYNGNPYIAYQDGSNSNKASLMKFNGSSWDNIGDPGFSSDAADFTSLAVSSNIPYVAFRDAYLTLVWQETQPAGNVVKNWNRCAMANNGSTIVLVTYSSHQRAYLSNDSGATWTEIRPSGSTVSSWSALAISSDGKYILVGESGSTINGRVFLSSNYGLNWQQVQPSGTTNKKWDTASMSSNGQYMLIGSTSTGGRAYISSNYGLNWQEVQPDGNVNRDWNSSAVSSDGSKMMLLGRHSKFFQSLDFGATWSSLDFVTTYGTNYNALSISSDWQKFFLSKNGLQDPNSRIFYSNNLPSFIMLQDNQFNPFYINWPVLNSSMSSDGSKILFGYFGGRLYYAKNFFNDYSFEEVRPAGDTNLNWRTFCVNSSGDKFLAAVYGGRVYLGEEDGNRVSLMKYENDSWQNVGSPGFSQGQASFVSMDFSSSIPYVAFKDQSQSGKLSVMKYENNSWQNVGDPGFSPGQAEDVILKINNNIPYIAFKDLNNSGKLSVMRFFNNSWQVLSSFGISPGAISSPSLSFSKNIVYVSFSDASLSGKAVVMKYENNSWQDLNSSNISSSASDSLSLFVYRGSPYLAYKDMMNSGKISVKKYIGGSINSWRSVGSLAFSESEVESISLFVDNGIPYVSYRDLAQSGKLTVKRFISNNP